jgi:hypothetical protein
MITHLLLAQLSNQIYDSVAGFDQHWQIDDVLVGLKQVDGNNIIVFRGSANGNDWLHDVEALPVWHSKLGMVHAGFLDDMDQVYTMLAPVVSQGGNVYITGHSLGGARARILAAMFACDKVIVELLCTFGSPKPAFINLTRIIEKSGMQHVSYRNRNDVVPLLPAIFPLWQHTEKWNSIDAAPAANNFEPLRDHSCELYVKALSTV